MSRPGPSSSERDRRITFQQPVKRRSAAGGAEVDGWEDIAETPEVWASFDPIGGREFFASNRVIAEAEAGFTTLYRADLSAVHSVLFEGVRYEILQLVEIPRRQGLAIQTRKVQA